MYKRQTLTNAGITILLETFTLISSGIILYVISPLLFLIVLGIALIYIITMLIFKDPINKLNENLMAVSYTHLDVYKRQV